MPFCSIKLSGLHRPLLFAFLSFFVLASRWFFQAFFHLDSKPAAQPAAQAATQAAAQVAAVYASAEVSFVHGCDEPFSLALFAQLPPLLRRAHLFVREGFED